MSYPVMRPRRRITAVAGLTGATLAATLAVTAAPAAPTTPPAPKAALTTSGWLATQLSDGVVRNDAYAFDDHGLTLDIGLGMDEVGGDQGIVRQIRQAMSTRVDDYVTGGDYGDPSFRLAGELAKALVFAQVSGADPASYGGYDLVTELERTVIASGPSAGRIANHSPAPGWSDYANTFSQAYAARGLTAAGSSRAAAVTDFLLQQQCDAGNFRVFFAPDKDAAEQGCVAGDSVDTDATAFVVTQLGSVREPSTRVRAAVERAVSWLAVHQRTDGSFVGSAATPDPNTNSTGLAASALAAGGRCELAGRAAEWVTSLQVGPQQAGTRMAGQEGAIAYDRTALALAERDGITADTQDQWRRATVQSVAGLAHRLGPVRALTVAPPPAAPGASVSLAATGGVTGDRFCLSGPGIAGSRTVVVGSDGVLRADVTLPAGAGTHTYALTGRDGRRELVVDAQSLAPTSGVRLTGPTGFRAGGSRAVLEVLGAPAGARYTLRGPGIAGDVSVVVGSDGQLGRLVTLPASTGTASYVLAGRDGQVGVAVRVLGRTRLGVRLAKRKVAPGSRQRVVVRGLVAGERVVVRAAGRVVERGRATARGRLVARFAVPRKNGRVKVTATGQFPALRAGSATFRVR